VGDDHCTLTSWQLHHEHWRRDSDGDCEQTPAGRNHYMKPVEIIVLLLRLHHWCMFLGILYNLLVSWEVLQEREKTTWRCKNCFGLQELISTGHSIETKN
jgi:hypothetical protein